MNRLQPRFNAGLFYTQISPRISRALHTEPFRMSLEDTGWLSVPFCGPDSCETRFITKR
uniref:Prolyl-tRNA synthetase n=1 Tax=Siphoviridae sp. cttsA2 TaxID=2826497 RepID=A0A8S5N9Y1_9CAUD|nr:MAG TPA: prolyl-tRNA synthetase [Siphoviridae sp. cttsA2]DAM03606.1 MAG TPA: prolyl-tRNA synthetase [Caudoviricetes sp.]